MCQANKEFAMFLGYSLRSTAEVQSLFYAAIDIGYISEDYFNSLVERCSKIARLIQGFIRYLKTSTK